MSLVTQGPKTLTQMSIFQEIIEMELEVQHITIYPDKIITIVQENLFRRQLQIELKFQQILAQDYQVLTAT